jgi:glycosyltransferase involved in cell wall biosynthesis
LVGGSPHPSEFEKRIKSSTDPRINYLGFVYGTKTHALMRNAYAYVQPSDLEGLSPVVLENMGMRTPIICSDIPENVDVVGDTAVLFTKGSIPDCQAKLEYALGHPEVLADNAKRAKERAYTLFSWDAVADAHIAVFSGKDSGYA